MFCEDQERTVPTFFLWRLIPLLLLDTLLINNFVRKLTRMAALDLCRHPACSDQHSLSRF
jgi:hypothetical protein